MRWPGNLGIVAVDALIVRVLLPTSAVAVALFAEARGWGLFHAWSTPAWVALPLAVIILDLAIYLQHVLFHALPTLWRLHRMHHADLDFDVTTGGRFHPVEIVLSMGSKWRSSLCWARLRSRCCCSKSCLNATAMFNHSNVFVAARRPDAPRIV